MHTYIHTLYLDMVKTSVTIGQLKIIKLIYMFAVHVCEYEGDIRQLITFET